MEDLVVYRVTAFSEALAEAFARLLPQLSPRLGALSEERLRRLLAAPAAALYVAERAGRIVGTLTLAWYDAPSGRKAWIEDVVVDAAARGCGAGEALVRAAQRHAAEIGAKRVMLTSNPSRTAARALYRKCGFNEAETTVFACKTDME
ncbi:GNAT family N-acetyltransferase [Alistipes sp. An66]|uniref:GNAT family N-acetyltransferase n=1 Tax=Alistipes sp. An66 TaxID=1965650 RepID=UPI000B37949A|nr:GNAT family N-acetyltransferase [Alistipes sp. An66]OUN59892.1 GNAT family N-acetyltransferase [Alistipes sp. An66]HIY15142.1 GNAT family N-acetyltransferase [Candidatus Alistipes cottocaccae]